MNNRYEIRGEVTAIFLDRKNGEVREALIDTTDLEKAKSFSGKWCFAQVGPKHAYVTGTVYKERKYNTFKLHRWLMEPQKNMFIDHINHDGIDNRRENLRITTNAENQQNRKIMPGIYYDRNRHSDKKWRARVRTEYRTLFIKYFLTREEAETALREARAKHMPFSKEAAS